eukprot:2686313-Ditylum_brightwellii.AAC.1
MMTIALGSLAQQQARATTDTANSILYFLNYCATYPDAILHYYASNMQVHVQGDASYLSEPEARSRAGGYVFLSNKLDSPNQDPTKPPQNNGSKYIVYTEIKAVMALAAGVELGALFTKCKTAIELWIVFEEMGNK